MAARFWQRVLAGELVFAAAVAWVLAILLPLSGPAMIASGLAILALLQWLPVAAACLLARLEARSRQMPEHEEPERFPLAWAATLRSIAMEGIALARAQFAMSVAPFRRRPGIDSSCGDCRRPVLLIHGVLCNAAVWRTVVRRLEEAGFGPVRTLDLEPLWADIEDHAARVVHDIAAMRREYGGRPVAIVAHSLGGLVARAALRMMETRPASGAVPPTGSQVVSCLVTIATPHHGTAIAALLPSKPMRQMSPRSPWLRALNANARRTAAAPITSIYSLDDVLVVPASSARLEGACNVELRGIGHLGLLTSQQTSETAVRALAAACLESAGSSEAGASCRTCQ